MTAKFLKLVNNAFDGLLDFAPIQTGYISGSLLVVPIVGKTIDENYKMRLGQEIITFDVTAHRNFVAVLRTEPKLESAKIQAG